MQYFFLIYNRTQVSINSTNGNINWVKTFGYYEVGYFHISESKTEKDTFYAVLSKRNQKRDYYSNSIHLFLVHKNGNIVIKKQLYNNQNYGLIVNDFSSRIDGGLYIVGRFINKNTIGSTAFYIETDAFFNYVDASQFINLNATFHSISQSNSERASISGYLRDNGNLFFINQYSTHSAATFFIIPNSGNSHSKIFEKNGVIYLFQYNGSEGVLHKIIDNKIVWSRKITLPNPNGIKDITFNSENNSFALSTYSVTSPTLIIRTNEEFNSCHTIDITTLNLVQRIDAEADFEITVLELQQLVPALSARIDELVVDPSFNPFKERLRQKNPVQFGSNPFTWRGVTYYLYVKTNPVDSEIDITNGFLELIQEFINQNKPLKYIFKVN